MNTIQLKIQKYIEQPWELPSINGDIFDWSCWIQVVCYEINYHQIY